MTANIPLDITNLPQMEGWIRVCVQKRNDRLSSKIEPTDIAELIDKGRRVVQICINSGLDEESQSAAFLHAGAPYSASELQDIARQFGATKAELVKGVQEMANVSAFSQSNHGEVSDENLRKMLIAMVNDVRVVLIKLADQVNVLRDLKLAPDALQRSTAKLTLDVYARLANRLGVWYLKWELEDLSLRYLEPHAYREIAQYLDEKRRFRENYIQTFLDTLQQRLQAVDVTAKVYGRPKHIYSIWRKMTNKGLAFENIMDIRAVRILVDDIANCYTALGIVHTSWKHLPGEFDDYIATPKDNGYQSIHTAVIGPDNKVVEVQIRTHQMHEDNELGVAAHWRYKEKAKQDQSIDSKILWLRQLLEWKQDLGNRGDLADQFDAETSEARIYVFTPKGKVIDLPQGSTPLDFAYAVHTEVGHKTRGARINNKMVTLNTALKTGDQVEIITVKVGKPSRDWIAIPGYVQTNRARGRILNWFKVADRDQHLAHGKRSLERELTRLGLGDLAYEKVADRSSFKNLNEMLAAIGAGDAKLNKLLSPFKREQDVVQPQSGIPQRPRKQPAKPDAGFIVKGVGNLKTQLANCCRPVPGERIVGFITRGRGVSIHQQDCINMRHLPEEDHNRLIDVEWGEHDGAGYVVEVIVVAYNRDNLLHDVTKVISESRIEVTKAILNTDEDNSIVRIEMGLTVSGITRLTRVLNQVSQIPNVLEVSRLKG